MPTSNSTSSSSTTTTSSSQQAVTDTNNNSNNKISNGHSNSSDVAPSLVSSLVACNPMTIAAAAVTEADFVPGVTTLLNHHNSNSNHNHHQQQQQQQHQQPPSPCTTPTNNHDLIASIKQHQHQQPTMINNNNNNNNNHIKPLNNHNSTITSNGGSRTIQQRIQQQQQQQQQQQDRRPGSAMMNGSSLRSLEELTTLIRDFDFDRTSLTNEELIRLVKSNQVSIYKLENFLGKDNAARCVEVRRDFYRLELDELDKHDLLGIRDRANALINKLKYEDLDYERVNGACCENVIGHVKVPVGLAGPLMLDGEAIFVPLATTEGCLVASTCRGLSALRKSGGVTSRIRRDFMTRAPIIRFNDEHLNEALDNVERAIMWLNTPANKEKMRAAFNLTSSHGRFINYTMYPVNREIHIRFEAQTGDAMGMNMCSKGVESALKEMQRAFPSMEIITLSGNMCTDKKAAGINWINGRGKAVECNAELPSHVVKQVFKVSVDQLVDRWKSKVMIGSALAASIGGFNSQAANILTAIFIATGQDPAQNVTSSNCMLILEKDAKGSLVVCCTMPSVECGTVGGGTILGDQSRYLQMMGVKGPTPKLTRQQQLMLKSRRSSPQQQLRQQAMRQQVITNGGGCGGGVPSSDGSSYISSSTSSSSSSSRHLQNNKIISNNLVDDRPSASASSSSSTESTSSSSSSASSSPSHLSDVIDTNEYTNARKLARIVCATVMAGELSLLAALTEGTLVKSHMRHNRSSNNVISTNLGGIHTADGGGGGGGGVGLLSPNQSCFGPLGSINNTTVINNHHHLSSSELNSTLGLLHTDGGRHLNINNHCHDVHGSPSPISPLSAATITSGNHTSDLAGVGGGCGAPAAGNRLCQ